MKLDGNERIALMDLLNVKSGGYNTLSTLRRVRGMIGFDPGEIEKLEINDGNYNQAAATGLYKDLSLDEWTADYIRDMLLRLDKSEQLQDRLISLYDKFVFVDRSDSYPVQDEVEVARLQELRQGLKTAALVGMSPISCAKAPFQYSEVELWSMNEAHAFKFMKGASRWFQVHYTFAQKVAKRGVRDHYDWLKKNPWSIPIYMIRPRMDIPKSVAYPLDVVCNLLNGIRRGNDPIKYFNSSFDYMMGLAILEEFERVEVYGFDMAGDNEFAIQKPSAEFWIGLALGKGIEIYLPPGCMLMKSTLYGIADQGEGWE